MNYIYSEISLTRSMRHAYSKPLCLLALSLLCKLHVVCE